ncbi:MAG: hypothetical protein SF028_03120 [Candidatus Sumerlaeia bacterium]|nr:hypothetical protein [Candidatus Sumerlaeia bacterium]
MTTEATVDMVDDCDGGSPSQGGIWYTFTTASATRVLVTTCDPSTNFDTEISVYEGGCGLLSCVAYDDNGCDDVEGASRVEFDATAATTYLVLVHGTETGEFILSVSDEQLTACDPTGMMVCGGGTVSGNTFGQPINYFDCDDADTFSSAFWYTFTGTGEPIRVSTCNPGTDYDTRLAVYEATNCAMPICVAENDDADCGIEGLGSEILFPSELGTEYYIAVYGFDGDTGNFELSLECGVEPPTGGADPCDAIGISCGDSFTGNNLDSDPNFISCFESDFEDVGAVWFEFQGTGAPVTFSTCSQFTNFDTVITVFDGNCEELSCVDFSDDSDCSGPEGVQSEVTIFTEDDATYYIAIHGANSEEGGNFELTVSCDGPPPPGPGEVCGTALPIACDSFVSGNTENGLPAAFDCGGEEWAEIPRWYTFVGDGQVATLSTCHPDTDFDTVISVFTGDCGEPLCIDSNNDAGECGDSPGASEFSFQTNAGETYFVAVYGAGLAGEFEEYGTFSLTLTCGDPEPTNDIGGIAYVDSAFFQDSLLYESPAVPGEGGNFLIAGRTVEVGDDGRNLQQRGIFGYPMAIGGAEAVDASLRLTVEQYVGDVSSLGDLVIELANPFYGSAAGWERQDFQSPPTFTPAATVPNDVLLGARPGDALWVPLDPAAFASIPLNGNVQFRFRFANPTNGNNRIDLVRFGAGGHSNGNRQVRSDLVVTYTLPTQDGCGQNPRAGGRPFELDPIFSNPVQDGFVVEHAAIYYVGSLSDNANTSTRFGDLADGKQVKAILAFDTSVMNTYPGAEITSASLCVTRRSVEGDPGSLGSVQLEMVCPNQAYNFGPSVNIDREDFEAYAWIANAGLGDLQLPESDGDQVCWPLTAEGLAAIQRLGHTQFRLVFESPDNGDTEQDVINIYSGNARGDVRPQLLLEIAQ